jgi:hypothetical protein
MCLKKIPKSDKERIKILRAAIDREELNDGREVILNGQEMEELRKFIPAYEGTRFIMDQAEKDCEKSQATYEERFKLAQMYVSHFIQVLLMSVMRSEIKPELLSDYGFENVNEPKMPDLSTEEALTFWGEKMVQGEAKRISFGSRPLQNPTIAKVKVFYEMFTEITYSAGIFRQTKARHEAVLIEQQKKSESFIRDIWTRVEEKFGNLSPSQLTQIREEYHIPPITPNETE